MKLTQERKQSSLYVMEINDSLVSEAQQFSEAFNDNCATLGSKLAEEITNVGDGGMHLDYFNFPK